MLKRDIQGKFALKDDDYRQVRSVRLTDETWKALGQAAECFGMSRADYLEQVIKGNANPSITRESSGLSPDNIWIEDNAHPCTTWEKQLVHQTKTAVAEQASPPLHSATLETLRNQVLLELKLGKLFPGL